MILRSPLGKQRTRKPTVRSTTPKSDVPLLTESFRVTFFHAVWALTNWPYRLCTVMFYNCIAETMKVGQRAILVLYM